MTKKRMSSIWKKVLPSMYIFIGAIVFFATSPTRENFYASYLLLSGIVAGIVCVFTHTHAYFKKIRNPVLWPVVVSLALLIIPMIVVFIQMLLQIPNEITFAWEI